MVSDQQNLQNVGSAANLAKINLNLDLIPVAEWSDEDMISYLDQLAGVILANVNAFNAQTIATATYVHTSNLRDLYADDSSALPQLKYELANNAMDAGADLAKLGQGTLHLIGKIGDIGAHAGDAADKAVDSLNWIIPVAAIGLLYLVLTDPNRGSAAVGGYTRAARNVLPY